MAKGYSHTTLVGRVGTDPETKTFNSGTQKTELRLAVNRMGKNKEEVTDWFTCSFWGKSSEIVDRYVRKGMMITVGGRLESNQWEDRSGGKRVSWELNVQHFVLPDKTDNQNDSYVPGPGQYGGGGGYQGNQGKPQQRQYTGPSRGSGGATGGGSSWLDDDDGGGVPF
jgi:single-strand DNA-binding protein